MILDEILLQFAKSARFPDVEFCHFLKCKLNIWVEQMTATFFLQEQQISCQSIDPNLNDLLKSLPAWIIL